MSGQHGGRKREKYIPLKDRLPSNVTPLCDQPEAQPYLMTIESMLEKSTATLHDSIWAPKRLSPAPVVKQSPRQPSYLPQKQSPAIKIETANAMAWNTTSQNSPDAGLVGSHWAVQSPPTADLKPEGVTSSSFGKKPGPQTTILSPQLRGKRPSSYVPPHLRGIDPVKASQTPQPMFVEIQDDLPTPASVEQPVEAAPITDPVPVSKAPNNYNAEGEEWARKMGLLPPVAPAKQAPTTQNGPSGQDPQQNSSTRRTQKSAGNKKQYCGPSQANSTAPHSVPQRVKNAFDNERFHLKQDSTEQFNRFVQKAPAINGKKYTFSGLAPSAQQQNTSAANDENHPWNIPAHAPDQQPTASPKPTGPAQQFSQYSMQPKGEKTENKASFSTPDPHTSFSPSQMTASKTHAKTLAIHQVSANSPRVKDGPWPSQYSTEVKVFNEKIAYELTTTDHVPHFGAPLTQDALVQTTGFKPREHSVNFEDKVSDDGVIEQAKEGIRAIQGIDAATQLLDWDRKRWAPPPCDWENDRAGFDDSFIPEYVKEWRAEIPCGPSVQVNTACDEFILGKCPIDNDVLIDPIEQPESVPDIANSCDEMKRLHQTAIIDANNYLARAEKKQRYADKAKAARDARHLEIAMAVDEPNPFSPKIDMYVRPVQEKDADAIMKIYNHYVATSIVPEDQDPISITDAQYLIESSKKEKLPFVVAVKGRIPAKLDAQRRSRTAKVILPQVESVIGFAFAERFNYAFSGSTKGRSRGTVCIQLYVHPEHTRKGVGRNTLDQLLHCMATAYTFKNGCPWINPDNDPVHEPNGCGLVHQMIMQVPVLKKNDPTLPWLSKFLYNKFWFKEENRFKSVARSSIKQGAAHMLDLAILQCELLHEAEFDCYV